MTTKDCLDVAMSYADLASKLLQFLILVNIAIGGWIIASDELRTTQDFSAARVVWAGVYTIASFVIIYGLGVVMRKMNACFKLASQNCSERIKNDAQFSILTRELNVGRSVMLGAVFVVLIDVLLLTF